MTSNFVELVANGTLLHRQLYTSLREEILAGRYRRGERLPTQEALCQQFSVSRITVRRALGDLQSNGLIYNKRGGGTFVAPNAGAGEQRPPFGFVDQLRRTLRETTVEVLLVKTDRSPPAVAVALGLGNGEAALHVIRTRSRGQIPVMLLDSWIPLAFAKKVTAEALGTKPLLRLISASSKQLGKVIQEVNGALASPLVAKALAVEVNSAMLKIDRLIHNRANSPIQHVTLWSTPLRSRMVMEFDANDANNFHAGQIQHYK
jgi:GntR family transcriptional regulator